MAKVGFIQEILLFHLYFLFFLLINQKYLVVILLFDCFFS